MTLAVAIRMNEDREASDNVIDIKSIYLEGCPTPGWYLKEKIYDYLKKNPGAIRVNHPPYPELIPALSGRNEKYVRSTPNDWERDNLLRLPKK